MNTLFSKSISALVILSISFFQCSICLSMAEEDDENSLERRISVFCAGREVNYSAQDITHDYQHEYSALLKKVVKALAGIAMLKGQMPSQPLSAAQRLRISGEVDQFTQRYPTLNILNIPDETSHEEMLKQQNLALFSLVDDLMAEKYPLLQKSKKRLFKDVP